MLGVASLLELGALRGLFALLRCPDSLTSSKSSDSLVLLAYLGGWVLRDDREELEGEVELEEDEEDDLDSEDKYFP